ncbi:MAG: ROK family protein [Bacteroidota bacterium]
MNRRIAIGVDIGGQHIACTAIDIDTNELISDSLADEKVDNKAFADEILSAWAKALQLSLSHINIDSLVGIGFAMPGPFDYVNGIALFTKEVEKFENLYNVNIIDEIRKRLSLSDDIPIRFINDATAFGIAEAWIGKAQHDDRLVALTLGTGFGTCFIEKGIPVIEDPRVPKDGCLWYLPFNGNIADDSFSTRWFENNYLQRSGKVLKGVKGISLEARQGNEIALQLFREYGTNMGKFLSQWLKNFDAQCLVIGGKISGSFDLFGQYLTEVFSANQIETIIHVSDLRETASIVGAARLIDDSYYDQVKNLL